MTFHRDDFADALAGLEHGDFSRLEPLFESRMVEWHKKGLFDAHPAALAEALTCACFLGQVDAAEYFLRQGVAPSGGAKTGLDAFHWAANRGQLAAVKLLLRWGARLDTRNMYGGDVLGATVWAAIHEPRNQQMAVIEELLKAGARFDREHYPTGRQDIDELLKKYGAVAPD